MTDQVQPEIEKIRTLKARYCRFLDTKQWEAFSRLLSEEIVLEFYDTAGKLQMKVEGREEVMRQMPVYFKHAQTVHQVKHHEIEVLTHTTARAILAVVDTVRFFVSFSERSYRFFVMLITSKASVGKRKAAG